jgi:hypothetical protein
VAAAIGSERFAVGGADGGRAAIWTSPDGQAWHAAARLPGGQGAGATVTALAATPEGRQWAGGVVDGAARVWSSAGGRDWAAVGLPGRALAPAGRAQVVALAAGLGRLLVVVQGTKGSVALMGRT